MTQLSTYIWHNLDGTYADGTQFPEPSIEITAASEDAACQILNGQSGDRSFNKLRDEALGRHPEEVRPATAAEIKAYYE